MAKTIALPAPIATIGEYVEVLNYRVRPSRWELGAVRAVTYAERYKPGFHLSYCVWLDRPEHHDGYGRKRGGGYEVQVNAAGVRKASR